MVFLIVYYISDYKFNSVEKTQNNFYTLFNLICAVYKINAKGLVFFTQSRLQANNVQIIIVTSCSFLCTFFTT